MTMLLHDAGSSQVPMPCACSWGRQVLYELLLFEPDGKKSEFSPSQGPTPVASVKMPRHFSTPSSFTVQLRSRKALLYEPIIKSGLTLISVV